MARVAASGGTLDLGTLITEFYGNFNFWVTLISLGIQLFLVSRIYQAVGVRGALLVHPIIVALGYGLLVLAPLLGGFIPIFSLIRRIKFAENGVDYSLMNTTRQALFLPVDRDSKYDGKTAIDTFFWRFGDLIQAGGIYVGLHLLDWQVARVRGVDLRAGAGVDWARGGDGARLQPQVAREPGATSPPEAVEPIPDLLYAPGESFMHPVSPTAFYDAEPGDVLKLRACCDDGRRLAALDAVRRPAAGVSSARRRRMSRSRSCASPSSPATWTASRRAALSWPDAGDALTVGGCRARCQGALRGRRRCRQRQQRVPTLEDGLEFARAEQVAQRGLQVRFVERLQATTDLRTRRRRLAP